LLNETADFIHAQEGLTLEGLGVNLTCYGAILPTPDNLQRLCGMARKLEERLGTPLKIISGGNSSSLYLLEKNEIPAGVNNLRLGESIVRGMETAFSTPYPGLAVDVVTLEAEIIEIMEKPSFPEGKKGGFDAFGQEPHFEDHGIRRRAILAVGRQDTDFEGLTSTDNRIKVVGASSDHLIVDITDSEKALSIGDTLEFSMSYGAILAGFTSKYVEKHFSE
ncbi:MAG: alanine/ornithine racemase family PLP-dependent enzyme, partial [Defluviitaleaceae bacterium]|nr:alanine/ornithine racemase family PLP-dependent enzyme [Defluviitaleaceae bacterium]